MAHQQRPREHGFALRSLTEGRLDRNSIFTMADSGASSASNFVLGSLVALRSSPERYGQFALAFALYGLTFGVWRAWATEPFLLSSDKQSLKLGHVVGASGWVGLAAMGVGLISAGLLRESSQVLILVVAICLPVLAAHDAVRFCLIGTERSHLALLMDMLWLLLMLTGSLAIEQPAQLIIWWGLSCALTLGLGLQLLAWPNLRGGVNWLRQKSSVGLRFVFEFFLVTGSNSVVMFAVGYSSGLVEMGAYRGAAVLVGPVAVATMGLVTIVLNVALDPRTQRHQTVLRRVKNLALFSFATGVLWAVVVSLTPNLVGQNVLGETWAASRSVALWFSIALGGQSAILVTTAGYRLAGDASTATRLKAGAMATISVSGTVASFFGGAEAAAGGFAVSATLCGLLILAKFRNDHLVKAGSDAKPVNIGLP